MITWHPQQEAVFTAIADGLGSYSVSAVAGGSKTSTIVEGASRTSRPILAVAFNKRNAVELDERLKPNPLATAQTMNSVGHRAWAKATSKRLTLDTDKLFKLTKELDPGDCFSDVLSLARAARVSGIVPQHYPTRGLVPDTPESWEYCAEYFDLTFTAEILAKARQVLDRSIKLSYAGTIDFDDQIYMSALFSGVFTKTETVIVDEAQDLSELQHTMLKKMVGERLFIVGDPHQAIYGFRGAAGNSMGILASTFGASPLDLSVSYRCPRAVVSEAQRYVPHIESWSQAPRGEVARYQQFPITSIPTGAHIVCRYNGPVFKLAWDIIKTGRGVTILGADIGQGLIKLVRRLAPEAIPIKEFLSRLRSYISAEIDKKPYREAALRDRELSLISISEAIHTSEELCGLIDKLFTAGGQVSLSSIHKAKGMEWNTVIFYLPQLLPSRFATTPWQLEQEDNLAYVAITRAKQRLIFVEEMI